MSVREVPAVSLQTVLDGVGEVDLLDMDIQDAEGNVVHASANLLAERVKTVYIGTHSEESEYLLRITLPRSTPILPNSITIAVNSVSPQSDSEHISRLLRPADGFASYQTQWVPRRLPNGIGADLVG